MQKGVSILVIITIAVLLLGNAASACWMFLSIEEMSEQAGLIVIGELTGDIREVVRADGSGVTFWSISVEHVLKGECETTLEVATGGLVTREARVMLSTDYRLDSYGELFLLYLQDDDEDGTYSPLTPRGIIGLERSEGGQILESYRIISEHHQEEQDEIFASVSSLPGGKLQASRPSVQANTDDKAKPALLVFLGIVMAGSVGCIAVLKGQRQHK